MWLFVASIVFPDSLFPFSIFFKWEFASGFLSSEDRKREKRIQDMKRKHQQEGEEVEEIPTKIGLCIFQRVLWSHASKESAKRKSRWSFSSFPSLLPHFFPSFSSLFPFLLIRDSVGWSYCLCLFPLHVLFLSVSHFISFCFPWKFEAREEKKINGLTGMFSGRKKSLWTRAVMFDGGRREKERERGWHPFEKRDLTSYTSYTSLPFASPGKTRGVSITWGWRVSKNKSEKRDNISISILCSLLIVFNEDLSSRCLIKREAPSPLFYPESLVC